MRFNITSIFLATVLSLGISLLAGTVALATSVASLAEKIDEKSHLDDKLYRRALYFYFAGDHGKALRQISINKERYNANTPRSNLFEAGLQIAVGLHHQASKTLLDLEQEQLSENISGNLPKNTNKGKSNTSPQELLLIARLQLAEQQIQQGENKVAQKTLSKITQLPEPYVVQYHTLNQLAYWPESPVMSAVVVNADKPIDNIAFSSSYIKLNQALLHIEREEFELAEPMLTKLKNQHWQGSEQSFWQSLFNPFSEDDQNTGAQSANEQQIQQQAVNDYAQLLLAQMYVKQGRYEAAFFELKNFPQNSPYTESALFIFAYSAHKAKQYTTSLKLLDLMQQRYPYSNLAWQSILLLAAQVTEQKSLEQGMASYQNAEQFYQQRLSDLTKFHRLFLASDNLLAFASTREEVATLESESMLQLVAQKTYVTESKWLQKALFDSALKNHYQALVELDLLSHHLHQLQQKSHWVEETLSLNHQRKAKIVQAQEQSSYQETFAKLHEQQQQIVGVIAKAENENNGQVFANQAQEKWLQRIKESKQVLASIASHRKTDAYNKRLKRIEGVLTWQLQTEFPQKLWQHKKLLQQIKQALTKAKEQRKRFEVIADSPQLLFDIAATHNKNRVEVNNLLVKVKQLRQKTSDEIRAKVQSFVDVQQSKLAQYLLTSRHEMARVLERMSTLDKRHELQLNPATTQVSNTQSSGAIQAVELESKESL